MVSIETLNQETFNTYGALKIDDAIEVIEEILLLTHHDVVTVQKHGINPRRIDVGIKETSFYQKGVQHLFGESIRISRGHSVSINEPNHLISDVFVKHAPIEWPEERFSRIFGFYGDVKSVDYVNLDQSDTARNHYVGKESGVVKVRLKIRHPIPSSMTIDYVRIEVYHRNQVRTCWKCGKGHIKANCKESSDSYQNRFFLEDFPILGSISRITASAQKVQEEPMETT